ncbi:phospholipase [Mycoplasma sp. 06067-C1-B144P-99-0482-3]|uniref:phospholipase n=1 Tax=Mycoplasma sp. 06067-C1-B144P-99-0482-3 TaxID=3117438 RepID=UPI003DA3DD78
MKQIDIQTIDDHQVKTYVFDKVKKPKAVLHIISSNLNIIDFYKNFFKVLNNNQIIVVCNSIQNSLNIRKQARILNNNWKINLEDLKEINHFIKKQYKLPIFMFSHSVYCAFSKAYSIKYSETIDGLILSNYLELNKKTIIKQIFKLIFIKLFFKNKNQCSFHQYSFIKKFLNKFNQNNNFLVNKLNRYLDILEDDFVSKKFDIISLLDVYKTMYFSLKRKKINLIKKHLPILIIVNDNNYQEEQKYLNSSYKLLKQLLKKDYHISLSYIDDLKNKMFSNSNLKLENQVITFINTHSIHI